MYILSLFELNMGRIYDALFTLYMFCYRFVSFMYDFVYMSEWVYVCVYLYVYTPLNTQPKKNIIFLWEFVFAFSSLLLCRIRFAIQTHTHTHAHTNKMYVHLQYKNTQSSPIFYVRNIKHTYIHVYTYVPYFFSSSFFSVKFTHSFSFHTKMSKYFYSMENSIHKWNLNLFKYNLQQQQNKKSFTLIH